MVFDGTTQQRELDADLIVSAVIAGFLIKRSWESCPLAISFNGDESQKKLHEAAVSFLTEICRDRWGAGPRDGLRVSATPAYDARSRLASAVAISGHRSSARTPDVVVDFFSDAIRTEVASIVTRNERHDKPGAYYGIVVDKKLERLVEDVGLTVARDIPSTGPEGKRFTDAPNKGVITGDASPVPGSVKGYCHGMVRAIAKCGEGQYPYEVAVGTATDKLASCFGCATFMAATNYPPSYMHLGQAQSWVPLPYTDDRNRALNARWAEFVADALSEGIRALQEKPRSLTDAAAARVASLRGELGMRSSEQAKANMFLDALTFHRKDLLRLQMIASDGGPDKPTGWGGALNRRA